MSPKLLSAAILLLAISQTVNAAIIGYGSDQNKIQVRCFGNFQLLFGECRPCKPGYYALNQKCVYLGETYLGSTDSGIYFQTREEDGNCEEVLRIGAGCFKCKDGFKIDQSNGKCIPKCLLFSQLLNKCLDNLGDLNDALADKNDGLLNSNSDSAQSLEVPTDMHISFLDQAVDLFSLKDMLKTLVIDISHKEEFPITAQNSTEILTPNNTLSEDNQTESRIEKDNNSVSVSQAFPHCADYREAFCYACENGYILNVLINQCLQVNGVSQKSTVEIDSPKSNISETYTLKPNITQLNITTPNVADSGQNISSSLNQTKSLEETQKQVTNNAPTQTEINPPPSPAELPGQLASGISVTDSSIPSLSFIDAPLLEVNQLLDIPSSAEGVTNTR